MRNRILFTTGDTLAPRTLDFVEPKGLPFLAKPFLVEELKLAVNGLLAGAATNQEVEYVRKPSGHSRRHRKIDS
jgi:hypothetical protein